MRRVLIHAAALCSVAGAVAFAQDVGSSGPRRSPEGDRPFRPTTSARTEASPPPAAQVRPSATAPSRVAFPVIQRAESVVVASTKDATKHKRAVCRLGAIPAANAGRILEQLFRAEGIALRGETVPSKAAVIVADSLTNSLIVSGSPEAVEEVEQLIKKIDQPATMIRFEIVVAEAPAAPREAAASSPPAEKTAEAKPRAGRRARGTPLQAVPKPEQMEVLVRSELTTLDNQPASLKMSRREPRVTGTSVGRAGMANSIAFENVGTNVALTPRVGPDKAVTMEIDVEDSRLGPLEEGAPLAVSKEGPTLRSPSVETLVSQCTVRIADGETVALAGMSDRPKSGKQRFILVTPHILTIGGE